MRGHTPRAEIQFNYDPICGFYRATLITFSPFNFSLLFDACEYTFFFIFAKKRDEPATDY